MQFFLLLLVVIAVFASAANTCDQYTTQKTCLSGVQADNDKCSWCSSAAAGANCFSQTEAKSLPSSIFHCEYQQLTTKDTVCDSITNQKSCLSTKTADVTCAWCSSAAAGANCFSDVEAKGLPSSIFHCDYQTTLKAKDTICDSITTEKSCMSTKTADVTCAWCKSAAAGANCFSDVEAKGLPSSVFQCEFQKAYALRGNN